MKTIGVLPFHLRLGLAWLAPVVAYWAFLYIATRRADPMAFPIIFAFAVLVPVANSWALVPRFKSRASTVIAGSVVPVLAAVFFVVA